MTNNGWRGPRAVVMLVMAAALLSTVSCARSLRNPFSSAGPPAPDVLVAAAPLDQIIAAVNQNAQKIQSYQTNNASITIPGSLGIPTLRGNIAMRRPGYVRLQASTALTGPEVDLGSNNELYWFWVRRNEPPQLYYSRHAQAAGSAAQQLMPIDPQWLLDALGLAEFKPTDQHQGPLPIDKSRVEIKSIVQSPSGPLVKRTVVDAHKAWVLEQHVYDGSGTLLASAIAKNHRYYPESAVSLPQVIEVRIPPAELAMTIDVGTVELNRLADNPQMWALPTIPGSPAVDLGGTAPAAPGGGTPTLGSQMHNADWYNPAPTSGAPPMMGGAPAVAMSAPRATTPLPSVATLPSASAGAAPQFVMPGGIPPGGVAVGSAQMGSANPVSSPMPQNAQRLPTGGVSASSSFVR